MSMKLKFITQQKDTLVGTPSYIAPEVIECEKKHTFAVDIWSLGVIFFKMIVGKPAFPGKLEMIVFNKIKKG